MYFNEYSYIMKKLTSFIYNETIDLKKIKTLMDNKNLIKNKDEHAESLNKMDFINNIKYITLKYINFKNNKGKFYFYCSFPLFYTILNDFINFQNDKISFYSIEEGDQRGTTFERILKYQFRVYKSFNIDGYFEVERLINMKPTEKFKKMNQEYITSKNNIFIDQQIREGEDYDFAIYKPKTNQLILLKSKYLIDYSNVRLAKSYYEKSAMETLKSFNELTKLNTKEVYLLFISSFYYNYDRRKQVVKTLSNKRINCIFYSLKNNHFYSNFRNIIRDIKIGDSSMLIPSPKYYNDQIALDNPEVEKERFFYKYKKIQGKKKEEEENEEQDDDGDIENLFLKKKKFRDNTELDKIYNNIISYIKNESKFNNESILKLLGPLKAIESYQENKYNRKKEYVIIFYLNDINLEIEKDRKMGLVIFSKGVHYFIDLTENKNYNSLDDLIMKFQVGFLLATGKKINN